MCGLVGFSGEDNASPDKLKLLMFWNAVERGKDSTGLYTPKQGVIKGKYDVRCYMDEIGEVEDNLFIGHLRAATVGTITDKNAHPFEISNVIVAHNGTLVNHWNLAWNLELKANEWDVDSQILAHGLNKFEDFKVLSMFTGAAALLWVDKRKPGRLLAFRNSERPLFRGKLGDGMYLSSIKESLEALGCTDVKELKENNVYFIHNGKVEYMVKVAPKQLPPVVTVTHHNDNLSDVITQQELTCIHPDEFKGTLVKPDNFSLYGKGVNNDEWLLCLGGVPGNHSSEPATLVVLHLRTNREHWISKYNCDWTDYTIKKGDFVRVICKGVIVYSGTSNAFCANGDILRVVDVEDDKYDLQNLKTKQIANITRKFFHKVKKTEAIKYIKQLYDEKKKNENIEVSKPKTIRKTVKFDKEMKEFVNTLLSSIEDKIDVIKERIAEGKDTKDAIADLDSLISENKFSIEEIVNQD